MLIYEVGIKAIQCDLKATLKLAARWGQRALPWRGLGDMLFRCAVNRWEHLDSTTKGGGHPSRNAGFIRQADELLRGCRMNPAFRW